MKNFCFFNEFKIITFIFNIMNIKNYVNYVKKYHSLKPNYLRKFYDKY